MADSAQLISIAAIIPSRDMQRSIAFYKALGFTAQLYQDGTQYAFLHRDECHLHLRLAAASELAENPGGLYLYVHSADSFYSSALANGLTPLCPPQDQPWNCREFAISDPDGLLLRIGNTIA